MPKDRFVYVTSNPEDGLPAIYGTASAAIRHLKSIGNVQHGAITALKAGKVIYACDADGNDIESAYKSLVRK